MNNPPTDKEQSLSIKRNFVLQGILSVSSILMPLLIYPYVARVLRPEMLGNVSFASSLAGYFSIIAALGMPTYGIRMCASHRNNETDLAQVVVELSVIRILTTCIVGLVFVFTVFLNPQFRDDIVLYAVAGTSLLFQAVGADWYFQGLERFSYLTISRIAFKAISVVLILLFVRSPEDYRVYMGLSVLSASGSSVLNAFIIYAELHKFPVHRIKLSRHMRPLLVFFFMSCATSVYGNLDTVLLGILRSNSDIGYYDVANKVKTGLILVSGTLKTVTFPRASTYWQRDQAAKLSRLFNKSLDIVWLAQLPLTTFFVIMAGPIILILAGEAYVPAVFPLQVLLICVVPIGLSNIAGGQILVPSGNERLLLRCEILGLAADLVFDLILIPPLGPTGAAIAAVAAEVVVAITSIAYTRSRVSLPFQNGKAIIIAVTGTLITSVISIPTIHHASAHLDSIGVFCVGAILFFGTYVVLLAAFYQALEVLRRHEKTS